MTASLGTIIEEIRHATTAEELRSAMTDAAYQMGFQYWCLVQRGEDGLGFNSIQYQNYPTKWIERLEQGYFYLHDPVLAAWAKSALPFWWSDLPNILAMTPKQMAYMEMAADLGLREGLTIPWHLPGEPSALCSLAAEDRPDDREVEQMALCVVAWGMEQARRIRDATTKIAMGLTDVERRVVTLAGHGLSPGAIAQLMDLTRDKVVAIQKNLQKRTRSTCMTQVIVRKIHDRELTTTELLF